MPKFTVTVLAPYSSCHSPTVALGVVVFFWFFLCFPPVCRPPLPFPSPAPVFLCVCSSGRGSSAGSSRETHLQMILLIIPCYITPVSSPLWCQIVPPVTVTISSASSNCVSLVYYRNWYSTFHSSCHVFPPGTPASYYLSSTCAAPGWLCLHVCTLTTAFDLCTWVQTENPDITLKAL